MKENLAQVQEIFEDLERSVAILSVAMQKLQKEMVFLRGLLTNLEKKLNESPGK